MKKRFIFDIKSNPSQKSQGYGYILDTQSKVSWDNQMATVFGNKKALEILDALNLKNELAGLKKGVTKKDILNLLSQYKINLF